MNCSESTAKENIVVLMVKAREQNPAVYLSCIAMICAICPPDAVNNIDWSEGYTRSSFKRAVKLLRSTQKQAPQLSAIYESAIKYIRTEWLHQETGAAKLHRKDLYHG